MTDRNARHAVARDRMGCQADVPGPAFVDDVQHSRLGVLQQDLAQRVAGTEALEPGQLDVGGPALAVRAGQERRESEGA